MLFICVAEGEGGEVGGAGVRVHFPGLEYQTNLLGLQVFPSCCYTHFAPKCTTIHAISREKNPKFSLVGASQHFPQTLPPSPSYVWRWNYGYECSPQW